MTIEEVNKVGYCTDKAYFLGTDKQDYESIRILINKPKNGGCYRTNKAYKLTITADDIKSLVAAHMKRTLPKPSFVRIYISEIVYHVLKANGYRGYVLSNSGKDYSAYLYVSGKGFIKQYSYTREATDYKNSCTVYVYNLQDFTNFYKDDTFISQQTKFKINRATIKDIVLNILRKSYPNIAYKEDNLDGYFVFPVGYAKSQQQFISDAIEYYLNDIVLKELGCKVKALPGAKTGKLFKLSDVESILTKGV